jgi:hypothetical protein
MPSASGKASSAPRQRRAVVVLEVVEAQRLGRERSGILDVDHVAEALAHLLAALPSSAGRCASSSARRAVVGRTRDCAISFSWCGKTRSSPPPWMSKVSPRLARHRGALDVPAGAAGAPRAVPGGLAGLAAFHSAKSAGSRLPLSVVAAAQLVDLLPGQLAVLGEGLDARTTRCRRPVGVAAVDQRLDHREDLGDVLAHPRLQVGRQQAEARAVARKASM